MLAVCNDEPLDLDNNAAMDMVTPLAKHIMRGMLEKEPDARLNIE